MPEQQRQSERLLNEAAIAFAQLGYAGASVRTIADAAGINGAMVSYYFGSKEGLFRAVLADRDGRIRERLTWSERSAGRGTADSERRWRVYLACVLVDFPDFIHLVWSHALLAGDDFPNGECRELVAEHSDLVFEGAPSAFGPLAVELLGSRIALMDRPASERQALADGLSPALKPRGRVGKRAKVKSQTPPLPDPVEPAPDRGPAVDAGDDFLGGFVD